MHTPCASIRSHLALDIALDFAQVISFLNHLIVTQTSDAHNAIYWASLGAASALQSNPNRHTSSVCIAETLLEPLRGQMWATHYAAFNSPSRAP